MKEEYQGIITSVKCMTKKDFEEVGHPFIYINDFVGTQIKEANLMDVLVFRILFTEGKWVITQMIVINEDREDVFRKLLKEGI